MSIRDETPPLSGHEPDEIPWATLEWVWSTLGIRYGHYFASKWDGFDIAVVKADWRYALKGLTDRQLQYGIDNLPVGRPPADVGEFRKVCLMAPAPIPQRALPRKRGPVEIPPEVRAQFEKLREEPAEESPRLRWARLFVAQWGEAKGISGIHKQALESARKVIRFHEQEQAREAEQRAKQQASTQQAGAPSNP